MGPGEKKVAKVFFTGFLSSVLCLLVYFTSISEPAEELYLGRLVTYPEPEVETLVKTAMQQDQENSLLRYAPQIQLAVLNWFRTDRYLFALKAGKKPRKGHMILQKCGSHGVKSPIPLASL